MAKANQSSGFFDLRPEDLKDPTLGKLNDAFRKVYQQVSSVFSQNAPTMLSSPTFATVKASAQSDPGKVGDNELVTKATADKLYGANASRQALLYGTSTQPAKGAAPQSTFQQTQPLPIAGGSGEGQWSTYIPQATNAGTITPDCAFSQQGNVVTVRIQFTGSSSSGSSITVTLPVPSVNDHQCFSGAIKTDGNSWVGAVVTMQGGNAVISRYDNAGLSGTVEVRIQGSYEVGQG